jgi:NADH dehydrogenase FAD-containing subunit
MDNNQQQVKRRTILVIGGSYAGLCCAHYFLLHALPDLKDGHSYNVTLVNTSAKFTARTANPRAAVSSTRMPPEKIFWDIAAGFKQYPYGQFTFIEGQMVLMDLENRSVIIKTATDADLIVPYYALIIATGSSPESPLLGVRSSQSEVEKAHIEFQGALKDAKCVVVAGGGPAAVEMAAEIARECNGPAGWFCPAQRKVEVLMLVRSSRLMNGLPLAVAQTAEKQLESLGVSIWYNTTVESIENIINSSQDQDELTDGVALKKNLKTSNGNSLSADLFIPARGVTPNTAFAPAKLLNNKGYIQVQQNTLRVKEAGPRVYAIGDCADYKRRDLLDLYAAVPVVIANLKKDLLQGTAAGAMDDAKYEQDPKHTQLIPVGDGMGVGLISGWFAPSWLVSWIKGRDYLAGLTPMIVNGEKWKQSISKLAYVLPR